LTIYITPKEEEKVTGRDSQARRTKGLVKDSPKSGSWGKKKFSGGKKLTKKGEPWIREG